VSEEPLLLVLGKAPFEVVEVVLVLVAQWKARGRLIVVWKAQVVVVVELVEV
jgi:hypothetical protein